MQQSSETDEGRNLLPAVQPGELNLLAPMLELVMDQRGRLLNYLFEHHYTPKTRAAATGVPGRALSSSTFGCSGWWRAGHRSLSCGCPSQPIACSRGWAQGTAPFPRLCPWEAAQLNSSSLFAGSGILQELLRGSSALGTGDAANTGDGALPCKAPRSCGVYVFHCS